MDSNNSENKKGCCGKENCAGCSGCGGCDPRCKLQSYDWLNDIPGSYNDFDIVEVQFKNTRKGFYMNSTHIPLEKGDLVAVEASPGHDIGKVSMTGRLVKLQMKRANLRADMEILRVFRKAKASDMERYEEAKAKEKDTMIRSRKIAEELKLNMKIGDVEYQGDGNKAIFYYIADERVDFRQLIKVLADAFKVRIEMKQIGARQEAGRIGGIGPCGRPLCCSGWMSNFVSVATSAARYQDISLNPQKLAGQCAKLKCCLNFEVDGYVEASKQLPPREVRLETKDNTYFHFKTDIFKKEITYSTDKNIPANLVTLSADRVFEVMALNKNGVRPDKLEIDSKERKMEQKEFGDIIGQDSVTRFDKAKRRKGPRNGNSGNNGGGNRRNPSAQGNGNRAEGGQQSRGTRKEGDDSNKAPRQRNTAPPRREDGQPRRRNNDGQQRQQEAENGQQRPRNNANKRPRGNLAPRQSQQNVARNPQSGVKDGKTEQNRGKAE